MTTQYGIDIASYEAGLSLPEVKSEGFSFVFAKATQGVSYVDPDYAGWAANQGGLIFVPYHYVTTENSTDQVRLFEKVVGEAPHGVMLDVERGGPTTGTGVFAVIVTFVAAGYVVDLYLPHWYWLEIGSPDMTNWPIRNLIASSYPSTAPGYASALYPGDGYPGWNEYGNRKPDVLQFTDNALVGGQHVDANAVSDLSIFDAAPPVPPKPVPSPVPAGWAATVKTIQSLLNGWPFSPLLSVDGIDGIKTEDAIRAFQRAAGIQVDGVAGPITFRHLSAWHDPNRPVLAQGSTGSAVKWLQTELNRANGSRLTVDGVFGPLTAAAVRAFQGARLGTTDVDGVAGRMTNAALQS